MHILLLGGSGFLGTRLSCILTDRGHRVDVVTRGADNRSRIERTGARAIVGDFVHEAPAVLEHAGKPDAVVLIAAPRLFGRRLTERRIRTYRAEVTAIFRATIAFGRRLDRPLVLSSGTSFRTRGEEVADETWPIERFGATRIGEQTDEIVASAVAASQPLIQMLPGQIYGPGGMFKAIVDMARRGRNGFFGDGSNRIPKIYVDDCAEAFALAVERSSSLPPGTRYIVADDVACTSREFSEELSRCLKLGPPRRIPAFVARLVIGRALYETVTANCRVTNEKLKRELGWRPRHPSFREGVPAAVSALERGEILP